MDIMIRGSRARLGPRFRDVIRCKGIGTNVMVQLHPDFTGMDREGRVLTVARNV